MSASSWVKVADFSSTMEAQEARAFLEAQGIRCMLPEEATSRMMPHLMPAMGFVRLLVQESDRPLASQLLQIDDTNHEVLSRKHGTLTVAKRASIAAGLGLLIIPLIPNFYSVKLILDMRAAPQIEISAQSRKYVQMAWAMNAASFLFYGLIIVSLFQGK